MSHRGSSCPARVTPYMHGHPCVVFALSLFTYFLFFSFLSLLFQPFQTPFSVVHKKFMSQNLRSFRSGTVVSNDHETPRTREGGRERERREEGAQRVERRDWWEWPLRKGEGQANKQELDTSSGLFLFVAKFQCLRTPQRSNNFRTFWRSVKNRLSLGAHWKSSCRRSTCHNQELQST